MKVFGFRQHCGSDYLYDVLFLFDEQHLYVINIQEDYFYSKHSVNGFKIMMEGSIEEVMKKQAYIPCLEFGNHDRPLILLPEKENMLVGFSGMKEDVSVFGVLNWVPKMIRNYIQGEDTYHFSMDAEDNPVYYDYSPNGLSNVEYLGLFSNDSKFEYYPFQYPVKKEKSAEENGEKMEEVDKINIRKRTMSV